MALGVAGESGTRPMIAGVPAGRFVAARRTPQEHAAFLEMEQRIVPVQSAHRGLELIERP
jgi:hypothetical protein